MIRDVALFLLVFCPALIVSQTPTRAQVHSQQVHGSIPGQIPNLLSGTTGDVYLGSKQMPPMRVVIEDSTETLNQLSCGSDLVVLGKLGKGTSSPTVDQGYIYTDWDLTVEQVFKDTTTQTVQPRQTIVVTRPGGELTVSGRHVYALPAGFPKFHSGEEVVLYLKALPGGTFALSSPNGFFLSRANVLPMEQAMSKAFAGVQRNAFLKSVQSAATVTCPLLEDSNEQSHRDDYLRAEFLGRWSDLPTVELSACRFVSSAVE